MRRGIAGFPTADAAVGVSRQRTGLILRSEERVRGDRPQRGPQDPGSAPPLRVAVCRGRPDRHEAASRVSPRWYSPGPAVQSPAANSPATRTPPAHRPVAPAGRTDATPPRSWLAAAFSRDLPCAHAGSLTESPRTSGCAAGSCRSQPRRVPALAPHSEEPPARAARRPAAPETSRSARPLRRPGLRRPACRWARAPPDPPARSTALRRAAFPPPALRGRNRRESPRNPRCPTAPAPGRASWHAPIRPPGERRPAHRWQWPLPAGPPGWCANTRRDYAPAGWRFA